MGQVTVAIESDALVKKIIDLGNMLADNNLDLHYLPRSVQEFLTGLLTEGAEDDFFNAAGASNWNMKNAWEWVDKKFMQQDDTFHIARRNIRRID